VVLVTKRSSSTCCEVPASNQMTRSLEYVALVPDPTPRQRLETIYRAAIDAIQPAHAVHAGLADAAFDAGAPIHFLALGKAARTMLSAALAWCDMRGIHAAGGLCISHERDALTLPAGFVAAHGDHPHPHDASASAAARLHGYVSERVHDGDMVVVLLSGGTSALIGAPAGALTHDDYRACCSALLRSGLDIHAHNAIRRLLSRWGNGRLGEALHAAGSQVTVLAISDVPGDAPASIGGAPCVFTSMEADASDALLATASLTAAERTRLRDALRVAGADVTGDFPPIPHRVISSNRMACEAIARAAAAQGLATTVPPLVLDGDAHACGAAIVHALLDAAPALTAPALWCWGGEPVMSLPPDAPPGGRMQALAMAAARALHEAGGQANAISILAAGTDGRDGATDAAGAVIDGRTWQAVLDGGSDPAALLATHDSHSALRSAGALIPAFASGTNVNDVVVAIVDRAI